MKRHPNLRWLMGMALLLLLGPPLALYLLSPRSRSLPARRFFPERASLILRLTRADHAWQAHWRGRGGLASGHAQIAPEDAIQQIMEATGAWTRWVKKYGATRARIQLSIYQRTLFGALGDEAWLIFGEWGAAAKPGQGSVGLVLMLRADSSLKSSFGPLADLFVGSAKIERKQVRGVSLLNYVGKGQGRSLAYCNLGGWAIASLRQRGDGPLPALIEQVLSGRAPDRKNQRGEALKLDPAQTPDGSGLALSSNPELFLSQLRQFTVQRGGRFSKVSEARMRQWTQTLAGLERIRLTQTGQSLFDLQMDLAGTSSTLIRQIVQTCLSALSTPSTMSTSSTSSTPAGALLAQVDLAVPAARLSLPLFGVSWDEFLSSSSTLDLFVPGLRDSLAQVLCAPAPGVPNSADPPAATTRSRIGLAAFPSSGLLIPGLLFWYSPSNLPADQGLQIAPGQAWADPTLQTRVTKKNGTCCRWITPAAAGANPNTPAGQAQRRWAEFENKVWSGQGKAAMPQPPLVFMTLNFNNISAELDRAPMQFFGKKARKQFKKWQSTMRGLALGMHGLALRLDPEAGGLRLSARTPF